MWTILRNRLHQGHRTSSFPNGEISLSKRFRGFPSLDPTRCLPGCVACAMACPTKAIQAAPLEIDLGKCLFCPLCVESCPSGGVTFTAEHRLAAGRREELNIGPGDLPRAVAASEEIRRLFGRSLKLRQVSAGGCNACEADLAVLQTVVFDLGRFGIQFVASPRHADGLVLTGPVTANMRGALMETYRAVPSPKVVIALGACAISGGIYQGGAPDDLPVDLFVPGCPPHPYTILDAMVRFLGKRQETRSGRENRA